MSNGIHSTIHHHNISHHNKEETKNNSLNRESREDSPIKKHSANQINLTDEHNSKDHGEQSNDDNNSDQDDNSYSYNSIDIDNETKFNRNTEYFDALETNSAIENLEHGIENDIQYVMNVHHGITSFFHANDEYDRDQVTELMIRLSNFDKNHDVNQINDTVALLMQYINDKNRNKLFLNAIFQLTKFCADEINATKRAKYIAFFTNIYYVCNLALKHNYCNIEKDNITISNIKLETSCAILTIKALSTDPIENKKAKNELFLMQYLLRKIKKGVATPEQLMEYTELAEKSVLAPSAISEGFGESLEVTINAETKGLHIETESMISTPIMFLHRIYFANEPIKFHLKIENYLELLAPPHSHFARLLPQPKYHQNNLRQIHQEIKSIFKELNKANAHKEDLKERYIECLKQIEDGIQDGSIEPEILTKITGKVKIQSRIFRGTLPSLLEILTDTFEVNQPITEIETNQDVESKENSGNTSDILNKTKEIIDKCYVTHGHSCSNYTNIQITKYIQDIYKHTDWESKIAASSAVHKVLYIINQSACNNNEKQLHTEIFLNKISTIEALKKHRSHISWLVAGAGALGIACAIGDSLDLGTTTSFIFDTFNTGFTFTGLTLIGRTPHELRGASTNERSIVEIIHRNTKKHSNNQPLISTFIHQYLNDNNQNYNANQLGGEIDTFINTNIAHSKDEFKQYIKSSIFEFSIKHKNCKEKHIAQPFIFVLIDQTNDDDDQKLFLQKYYRTTLHLNNPQNNVEHNEAQFNKLITTKHLNRNEGMLNFCKILAIIANVSNINGEIATNMSETLTKTLIHARKDKFSNWHILVNKELKVNILIKFAITAASFALWLAAVAFLTPIVTPIGIIFITIGLRLARIWLHKKCEIHDKAILERAIFHAENMQTYYHLNQDIRKSIDTNYPDMNSPSIRKPKPTLADFNASDEYKNNDYPIDNIRESTIYYDFNAALYYEAHDEHKSNDILHEEEKNHIDNLTSSVNANLTYQQRYQQKRLEEIIHRHIHHTLPTTHNTNTEMTHGAQTELTKELITFWINQTHDSKSLISTLETIVITINNSKLLTEHKTAVNEIKVGLKLAFKSASLKKIIEHRQSNIMLDILMAAILSTSDWASPLATTLVTEYLVSVGMAAIRAIILECNMNKLFTKLGLESNNRRECNRIIEQINAH